MEREDATLSALELTSGIIGHDRIRVPKWDRRSFFVGSYQRESSRVKTELNKPILQLRQVSMHSTERDLAYQEEWQVAAVVSTMKSCRLSANRLESLMMYTVGK